MIELKINQEIRDVKSDALGGLTLSQAIFGGSGLLVGIGTSALLYFKAKIPLPITVYISALICSPLIFLALFTYHQMSGVQALKKFLHIYKMPPLTFGQQNEIYLELRKEKKNGETKSFTNRFCRTKKKKATKD